MMSLRLPVESFIASFPSSVCLSDVLFHDLGRSHVRLVRVAAGLSQRAALAQKIPALIELDLYGGKPARFGIVERCAVEQLVLFADELLNVAQDRCLVLFVCHSISFLSFQC